ncbi:putative nuclease HARBI1 [Anoplophora glabripennis]|uniref:putative nuclease HARBI1 n=1 Tax=Anoplophora glabripennis TaxID=217634 RepID=UPI000873919D|nr:putative nuclease HARBI1 [Anoplophora glabripennis]
MDELVYLHLLEQEHLENEEQDDNNNVNNLRDPFVELSDGQFRNMFRLSKDLVRYFIESIEPYMRPKLRATDLSVTNRVLVALRFFASGSYQLDIGSNTFLRISQPSVSRCIREVITAVNGPNIFNEWVKFPNNFNELDTLRVRFYEKYNIPGVIGCVDCTHIAIYPPSHNDNEHPEHIYM